MNSSLCVNHTGFAQTVTYITIGTKCILQIQFNLLLIDPKSERAQGQGVYQWQMPDDQERGAYVAICLNTPYIHTCIHTYMYMHDH